MGTRDNRRVQTTYSKSEKGNTSPAGTYPFIGAAVAEAYKAAATTHADCASHYAEEKKKANAKKAERRASSRKPSKKKRTSKAKVIQAVSNGTVW